MVFRIILILVILSTAVFSADTVYVHEWGIVDMSEPVLVAKGAEEGYLDENGYLQPWYGMAVDAPVVWFHGPEFTGTFSVQVNNGYFTVLIPDPLSGSSLDQHSPIDITEERDFAVWENISCSSSNDDILYDRRGIPIDEILEGFQWAMPFWRMVPALSVEYASSSYMDRFIYYECTALEIFDEQEQGLPYFLHPLRFRAVDGELQVVRMPGPLEGFSFNALSDDEIIQILSSWGDDSFLEEEIIALWKTWKPVLLSRCLIYGEELFLFPLNQEQIQSISTLELETDQDYPVRYSRLFLAISSI